MRETVALVAMEQSVETRGVLKDFLGGGGCPCGDCCSSWWAALCNRSTAAWPAAPRNPRSSSGSAGTSGSGSLQHTTSHSEPMYILQLCLKGLVFDSWLKVLCQFPSLEVVLPVKIYTVMFKIKILKRWCKNNITFLKMLNVQIQHSGVR